MLTIELAEIECTKKWSIIKAWVKSAIPLNFFPHYRIIRLYSGKKKIFEDFRNVIIGAMGGKLVYKHLTECLTKYNIWDYFETITKIELEVGIGYRPFGIPIPTIPTDRKTYTRKEFMKYVKYHD